MYDVLIDLSHNEQVQSFPENIYENSPLVFHFNRKTDDLRDLNILKRFDLIILGSPKPLSRSHPLIQPEELITLKKFVNQGGNLFITSSAHGDYDIEHSNGSLRVLYRLTGVQKYYNAALFSLQQHHYHRKKMNIKISQFPKHPLFLNFSPNESVVFGKSSFFLLHPEINLETTLFSPSPIYFHDFTLGKKKKISAVPLLTATKFGKGRCISCASSSFLTKDPVNGVEVAANAKFLKNLLKWLLKL